MRKWISIGVTLIALWVVVWLVFRVVSVFVHLLAIAGLAFLVWALVRRAAGTRVRR